MIRYQGRKWDAPFTDDAIEAVITGTCGWCYEEVTVEDNAVETAALLESGPGMLPMHLECHIRMMLGSVAHLEGRCTCRSGSEREDDAYGSVRQEAQATLEWLISHSRGRFHEEKA